MIGSIGVFTKRVKYFFISGQACSKAGWFYRMFECVCEYVCPPYAHTLSHVAKVAMK